MTFGGVMSANMFILFGLVETTDMDLGTLADIGRWQTLVDIECWNIEGD